MAGNSERIDDIVNRPAVEKQVNDTINNLIELEIQLADTAKGAALLNTELAKAQTFRQYQQSASRSATETAKLEAEQVKLLAINQRLQQEIAKTTQQEARATVATNQAAVSNARTAQTLQTVQNRTAAASGEYARLSTAYRAAELAARNAGAAFGPQSEQFLEAAASARVFRTQLDAIDQPLGNYQRNVGNYASRAFGAIRTLANIIPNFGIGTFFLVLGTGIAKVFDIIRGGESTLGTNIKLAKAANDTYAEQSTKVALLVAELQGSNTTQERQQQLLEQLNETSPRYFGNLRDISDVVGKLPEAYRKYNEALLLNSRIQAGQSLLIEKNKELLEQQRLLTNLGGDQPKAIGYLDKLKEKFQGITNLLTNKDLLAGFNAEGFSGLLDPSKLGLDKNIKNIQKSISFLQKGILSDSQKLSNAGGDIAGDGLKIQERIINNGIELDKQRLESSIDASDSIVNNDKKSYSERQSALKSFTDTSKQLLYKGLQQELNDVSLTNDARRVITGKYNQDLEKLQIDSDKKSRDLTSAASKDQVQVYKNRLERQKAIEDEILSNTTKDYKERFDAVDKYEKLSKDLIKTNANEQIKDAGKNGIKIIGIQEQRQADLIKVDADGNKKRSVIQKEIQQKLQKDLDDQVKSLQFNLQTEVTSFRDAQNDKLLEIEKFDSIQKALLAKSYEDGKINNLQYEQGIYNIEQDSARKRINIQLETTQKVVDAQKVAFNAGYGSAKDLKTATDEITRLQIQSDDLATKVKLDNIQKVKAARQNLASIEREIVNSSIDLIQTLIDKAYTNQSQALDKQSQQISDQADLEKENVDRSLLSAQQKADKNAIIDAQATAQKEVIAERQKKIQIEAAKIDKAISIGRIAITTAEAVYKLEAGAAALVPELPFTAGLIAATLAQIPAIIALGAIQAGLVLAAPLPQFAAGGTVGKDGHIITGELGTELRIDPDGKTSLTKDFANVSYARKGTKIVPHMELMGMLKAQDIKYTGGQVVDMTGVIKAIKDNKPQQSKQPVLNGWGREIRGMEKYNNYSKKHFN